jgi:O-antigen ligase
VAADAGRGYVVLASVPFLLAAFGDLRNVLTPLGYWVAWLAAVTALLGASSHGFMLNLDRRLLGGARFAALVMAMLLMGIVFSSLASQSYGGFYDLLKLVAVFAIGYALILGLRRLDPRLLFRIAELTVYGVLLAFLVAKFAWPGLHIRLGDGRQGLLIAYPGVMWKAGAFLLPVFLLAMVFDGRYLRPLLGSGAALALVLIDGSRTGLLWIGVVAMVCASAWLALPKPLSRIVAGGYALVLAGAVALVGAFLFLPPLALGRLVAGDEAREQMAREGAAHVAQTFPYGGGIWTTVSDSHGGMVVHNAYLQAAGDLGAFGLLFVASVVAWIVGVYGTRARQLDRATASMYLSSLLGVLCFLFLLMLHPLSTEMSEWGWFFAMFALAQAGRQRSRDDGPGVG